MNRTASCLSLFLTVTVIICFFQSCRNNSNSSVEKALEQYDRKILSMNADTISSMFTEDGTLGQEGGASVSGRKNIKEYFIGFEGNVSILRNESVSESSESKGDTVYQKGTYQQKVVLRADTLEASGKFNAVWVKSENDGYLLSSMLTAPDVK